MEEESQKTGLVVSGAMHLALLAVLAIGFSRAPKFDDATESIPVETITTSQLNEIMQGEKNGKPAPPPKVAEAPPAPTPPTRPEPAPPTPEPPKRPPPPAPEPPKRPETAMEAPPPPEPPKRPEPPKPEPPKPPKPETQAPTPPVRTHVAETHETPPRPPEKPRPAPPKPEAPAKPDKSVLDEIAKTLAKEKAEEKPHAKTPVYDQTAISKMIGQTRTAENSPQASAPQGLPNRNAPRMSVSLENGLNEWFRDSYKNCWNLPPSNPAGENYVFNVRVTFNPDGSLATRPEMLNPPHDPEWRAHADSVMRAVQRCNPLHIPAQYAPYFEQWRTKVVHFDPSSAEG